MPMSCMSTIRPEAASLPAITLAHYWPSLHQHASIAFGAHQQADEQQHLSWPAPASPLAVQAVPQLAGRLLLVLLLQAASTQ